MQPAPVQVASAAAAVAAAVACKFKPNCLLSNASPSSQIGQGLLDVGQQQQLQLPKSFKYLLAVLTTLLCARLCCRCCLSLVASSLYISYAVLRSSPLSLSLWRPQQSRFYLPHFYKYFSGGGGDNYSIALSSSSAALIGWLSLLLLLALPLLFSPPLFPDSLKFLFARRPSIM